MLSGLSTSLPGFGRDNWQSLIRKFVTVHPEYADMQPWTGRETADIVYHDTNRVFTQVLIDKNYLDAEDWVGKKPRYLIEVKTTTGSCNAPFFMSKAQYRRVSSVLLFTDRGR